MDSTNHARPPARATAAGRESEPAPRLKPDTPPHWLYADAQNDHRIIGELLRSMVADSSGRNGALQAALSHTKALCAKLQTLIEREHDV